MVDTLEFLQKFGHVLFDGYYCCKSDPKKRTTTGEPLTLEKALEKQMYIAGVLKYNVVLIDYDDPEMFERRLAIAEAKKEYCVVIRSQSRGGHFYYFDNQHKIQTAFNHKKTLLTFDPVDCKMGYRVIKGTGEIRKSDTYGALCKLDKSFREIVYCNISDNNTLDEVPFYDLVVNAPDKYTFYNMAEGEGRNDLFHSYMQAVKGCGFTYEQYLEAMNIINDFLLADPLPDEEFQTVTRREEWESIHCESLWIEKNKFRHDKFAEHIRVTYHIIKINGALHIYKDGVYVADMNEIKNVMVKEIPSLTTRQRNEVMEYLKIVCQEVDTTGNRHLISFKNGIYDLKENILLPFTPDLVITNQIPWNYNPDAQSEKIDTLLNALSCNDKQVRDLLEEVAGSCLYRSCKIGGGKIVILLGDKSNGKSTFIEITQNMLGVNNYSTVDMGKLGEKFSTVMLYGKLANIGDDISGEYIKDTSILKKLATGQALTVERKGQDLFSCISYATQIYSANDMPRTKDDTGAVLRRLLIVPMNATFTKDTPGYDPFISVELAKPENIEYFIQLALGGLKRILENNTYTIPEQVKQKTQEYEIENNSVLAFIQEVGKDAIINKPTTEVYVRYEKICADCGSVPYGKPKFTRTINRELGTTARVSRVNGELHRVYVTD